MRLTHAFLLVAALVSIPQSFACHCVAGVIQRLYESPATAGTAFLGKCEETKEGGKIFRSLASWTTDRSAYLLTEKTSCDIRCQPGQVYLVVSNTPPDLASKGVGMNYCNTITPSAGEEAASLIPLLEKTSGRTHASPNPTWLYCDQDKECTPANTICGGMGGVNRKYEAPYKEWVKKVMPTVNCVASAPPRKEKQKAACVDHLCGLHP